MFVIWGISANTDAPVRATLKPWQRPFGVLLPTYFAPLPPSFAPLASKGRRQGAKGIGTDTYVRYL